MEPPLAVPTELHEQARASLSSHHEEDRTADPTTSNANIDNLVTQSEEMSGDSPGTRTLQELDLLRLNHSAQETPTKSSFRILARPQSSGDATATPLHYQMPAANFRPTQLTRPNVLNTSVDKMQTVVLNRLGAHEPSHSEVSIKRPETELFNKSPALTPADGPETESSEEYLTRPATRGKDTATGPGHEKGFWQAYERDESTQFAHLSANPVAQPEVNNLADVERKSISFNFGPVKPLLKHFSTATKRPFGPQQQSAKPGQVSAVNLSDEASTTQPETVLPSIEVDGSAHDTHIEQLHQRVEVTTPKTKTDTQMLPPAPRARRQTSVLDGRVLKRPQLNMQGRKSTPQKHSRPVAADVSQPTEEDMYYLLMSRSRQAKDRELALQASHKKLRTQLHLLHEQSGTFHQELAAAHAQIERQHTEITAYQAQIENFKTRFTKFKIYAKDLAQDYTSMGKAMKQIGNTTSELIKDKADINHSLELLRRSLASASSSFIGLRPRISAVAQETGPLQHALHLAEVKLRMTGTSLQYERLRNNRIETQILGSQQLQERLSLSSTQEYRKASGYLDDMCQAILRLGKTVMKKQQPKDTPGIFQCLNLLQVLAEKQGAGITTLNETKALVGMISETLLSYHTSTEEATTAATSHGEQLRKDVLSQIAVSLGGLGPSMGTEVNFAILRERVITLQKQTIMGTQMINLAYDGKNASEQREKEQSVRFDKLLEQLAEANKLRQPVVDKAPSPRPGPDVNMILTKYMQASTNFDAEQAKVIQKDEELHHKSTEILALNVKLKTLQAEFEASQTSLAGFQEQDQHLRGQADATVQENVGLRAKLENLESASLQAARVPKLVEDLAAKDAELSQLRSQAKRVDELVQIVTRKDIDLKRLRLEAAKVPALVKDLTGRDTEIDQLRIKAAKVTELGQKLLDGKAELVKLREQASATSQLEEKLAMTEAQLNELGPKASQIQAKNAQNILFQSEIHGHKSTIQLLEQQLGPLKQAASEVMELQNENTTLKIEVESVKQSMQFLEQELKDSRSSGQEVESLKEQITALQINWGDYDQLKKDLTAQKDVHTKQVAHVASLQSKLEQSQTRAGQVPDLQGQVDELSQKCGSLNQQLSDATKAAEECQILQNGIEQKNDEIFVLKSKLKNFEEISHRLAALQQETQQKSRQLTALREQITKLQVDSQTLPALGKPEVHPVDEENYPTQQTMLEIRDGRDQGKQAHASDELQSNSVSARREIPRRGKVDRSFTWARNNVQCSSLRPSHAHETEIRNRQEKSQDPTKDTNNHLQKAPDSQPQINMRSLLASSSPLSELETASYVGRLADDTQRRHKDLREDRAPSSSYGGDSMLLEDFEAVEDMFTNSRTDSKRKADMPLPQRQANKHVGYGDASLRTVVTNQPTGSSSRRLRSGIPSQVIEDTQSQEQQVSRSSIVSSSPAGPMKHLPNSAMKRPRLDSVEATPSTQPSSKRLKRTLANPELSTTSKRPTSSGTEISEPEPARPARVSLPSGSRKGSVIGANALAPGKARRSRKTLRKGSKSDRYTERFSNE